MRAVCASARAQILLRKRDRSIRHLGTHYSSISLDARPATSTSTSSMRKRRRLPGAAMGEGILEAGSRDKTMRLEAENEELRLRADGLRDTVCKQAGGYCALLSNTCWNE